MTLNIKQIVTLGLGIGVVVAFGYRSLVAPPATAGSWDAEFTPLNPSPVVTVPEIDSAPAIDTSPSDAFVGHPVTAPSDHLALDPEMQTPLPTSSTRKETRRPAAEPSGDPSMASSTAANEAPELELAAPQRETLPAAETALVSPLSTAQLPASAEFPAAPQPAAAAVTGPPVEVVKGMVASDPLSRLPGWQTNPFMSQALAAEAPATAVTPKPAPREKPTQEARPASGSQASPKLPALEGGQTGPALREANSQASAIPEREAEPQAVRQASAELEPASLPLDPTAARRAVHHIEYGKALSRRGAGYSARQEFLAALKVIVDANDQLRGDGRHNQALRRAMQILDESADFAVGSPEQQIQLDVAEVVRGHRSQVLSPEQAAEMSAVQAMSHYFYAAQQQFDLAGGRNVVAAEIFFCLGKLHSLLPEGAASVSPLETARAVLFHQAALASSPQHNRSANELGVLFARSGRLEDSKRFFEQSLMVQPSPQTWRNLSQVHLRLGETDLARRAENEARLASQQQPNTQSTAIQWKLSEQFNADAPAEFELRGPAQNSPAPASSTPSEPSEPSLGERIKDLF